MLTNVVLIHFSNKVLLSKSILYLLLRLTVFFLWYKKTFLGLNSIYKTFSLFINEDKKKLLNFIDKNNCTLFSKQNCIQTSVKICY